MECIAGSRRNFKLLISGISLDLSYLWSLCWLAIHSLQDAWVAAHSYSREAPRRMRRHEMDHRADEGSGPKAGSQIPEESRKRTQGCQVDLYEFSIVVIKNRHQLSPQTFLTMQCWQSRHLLYFRSLSGHFPLLVLPASSSLRQ